MFGSNRLSIQKLSWKQSRDHMSPVSGCGLSSAGAWLSNDITSSYSSPRYTLLKDFPFQGHLGRACCFRRCSVRGSGSHIQLDTHPAGGTSPSCDWCARRDHSSGRSWTIPAQPHDRWRTGRSDVYRRRTASLELGCDSDNSKLQTLRR